MISKKLILFKQYFLYEGKKYTIDEFFNNINEIYKLSYNVLENHNLNYPLKISISNSKFPTKDYSNIILPEGNYDALKVEIGDAKGQNWWCVMFPPLCFVDDQNGIIDEKTDKKLKEVLTEEEYDLIMAKNKSEVKNLEFKFLHSHRTAK